MATDKITPAYVFYDVIVALLLGATRYSRHRRTVRMTNVRVVQCACVSVPPNGVLVRSTVRTL